MECPEKCKGTELVCTEPRRLAWLGQALWIYCPSAAWVAACPAGQRGCLCSGMAEGWGAAALLWGGLSGGTLDRSSPLSSKHLSGMVFSGQDRHRAGLWLDPLAITLVVLWCGAGRAQAGSCLVLSRWEAPTCWAGMQQRGCTLSKQGSGAVGASVCQNPTRERVWIIMRSVMEESRLLPPHLLSPPARCLPFQCTLNG